LQVKVKDALSDYINIPKIHTYCFGHVLFHIELIEQDWCMVLLIEYKLKLRHAWNCWHQRSTDIWI